MKSFFEKLTGAVDLEDFEKEETIKEKATPLEIEVDEEENQEIQNTNESWEEEPEEGELTIDMYQTPDEIIIKTMVAGVLPENLDVSITRDVVIIKGERKESHIIDEDDYYSKELYWGSFSRTINLPEEINTEEAEAEEKHGLLILNLPKTDKSKQTKLKVKASH